MKSGSHGEGGNSAALADEWAMFEEMVGESAFQADGTADKPATVPAPVTPSAEAANGVTQSKRKSKDKKDSGSSDDRYCLAITVD